MTEHTKIPVPADEPRKKRNSTVIERVVRNYDLVQLAPAPVHAAAIAPALKRRHYRRSERTADEAQATPVRQPGDQASSAKAPAETGTPEVVYGEVVERETTASPIPAQASQALSPVRKVEFTGQRYKINRKHLSDQGLILPEGAVSTVIEEFRIVKRQLLFNASQLAQQEMGVRSQRVLICSPHPGEGKSFTSVNLALAIAAEKETEVLLVDADFAKPSVLSMLGLPGGQGLMDTLVDPDLDPASCVIGTDIPGLWVLPAGNATISDSEYLSSSRTRAVLDRLVEGAPNRFVIFDSPPALAASPAAELAKYVGQAVLVARADRTAQSSLEDAISLLSACPNIQLLLNAVNFSPSGRRFGSYYGYGG